MNNTRLASEKKWAAQDRKEAAVPVPLPMRLPLPFPKKVMVIKCPLVTIHMPRCDLLNIKHHFCKATQNFQRFQIHKGKFAASIEHQKAIIVSASGRALPLIL